MLRGVPLAFLELREVVNNPLHVLNGCKLGMTLLVFQEVLDQIVNVFRHLPEILIHNTSIECVLVRRKHHLFHLLLNVFDVFQVYAVVL